MFRSPVYRGIRPIAAVAIAGAALAFIAMGPSGWDHKAISNTDAASKIVGSFSKEQNRLYRAGLSHIANVHEAPGRYTIRQVVRDEREREAARLRLRRVLPVTSRSTTSDSANVGGVIFFGLILMGIISVASWNSANKRRQREALTAHNASMMEDIKGRILTGSLPPVAVSINLARGEQCFFTASCSYDVMEKISHGSSAVGVSFRVAKGVRLRTYRRLSAPKELGMVQQDNGTLYLTDRHVIFVGTTASVSFTWARILNVTPFVDGVRYEVSNHRPVQFRTGDITAAFMSSVLQKGWGGFNGSSQHRYRRSV